MKSRKRTGLKGIVSSRWCSRQQQKLYESECKRTSQCTNVSRRWCGPDVPEDKKRCLGKILQVVLLVVYVVCALFKKSRAQWREVERTKRELWGIGTIGSYIFTNTCPSNGKVFQRC